MSRPSVSLQHESDISAALCSTCTVYRNVGLDHWNSSEDMIRAVTVSGVHRYQYSFNFSQQLGPEGASVGV